MKKFLRDLLFSLGGSTGSPPEDLSRESQSFVTDVWLEAQKQAVIGSPKKIEEGAKQVITLSTFLGGAYFAAVSFAKMGVINEWYFRCLFISPIVFWLIAIGFAVPSIVPTKVQSINLGDPLSSKFFLVDLVSNSLRFLRLALLFQLLGIAAMIIVLWTVLSGVIAYESEPVRLSFLLP